MYVVLLFNSMYIYSVPAFPQQLGKSMPAVVKIDAPCKAAKNS
jgi:hypothetical protein